MSQWVVGVLALLALLAFVAMVIVAVWAVTYEANFAQVCSDLGGIHALDWNGTSVCVQGVAE